MGRDPSPLAHLSTGEWRLRPAFRKSDPDELAAQQAADEALMAQYKAIYRFAEPWPASIKDEVHKLYRDTIKVLDGGMGCMQAAYQCLEQIHPKQPKYTDAGRESLRETVFDVAKTQNKYNNVELMMSELQKRGLAGEPLVVTFDKKAKDWDFDPEKELLKTFDPKQDAIENNGKAQILALLSKTQRESWKKAQGKPFKL